jgi:hypothetical protein
MKKIFFISIFFLSSCFGQCNQDTVDPSPVPSASSIVVDSGLNSENDLDANPATEQDSVANNFVVNFNGLEITYSADFKKVENETYSFVGVDPNRKLLLILNSENFNSTYDHYVLSKIRVLRNDNVNINDIDHTIINGINFSFVKSNKNGIHSWHLYTFKDKVGYEINCGGPIEINIDNICMDIIKTVKLIP